MLSEAKFAYNLINDSPNCAVWTLGSHEGKQKTPLSFPGFSFSW